MTEEIDKGHFIEVLEALHRDQTGLADALNRVLDIVNGYDWLAEGGRGSQGDWPLLDAIKDEVETSLRKSGRAHELCCGKYRHIGRLRMGQFCWK
jgi:hypothetical protein